MTGSEDVCIVGAGPAGIATAKVFIDDGYDVTVFEKSAEIGGTWSSSRRYLDLNHQAPEGFAELVGKPWGEPYASGESFQVYLYDYATEFGVTERIEFETEVSHVEKEGRTWTVEVTDQSGDDPATRRREFDYVVVCTGAHFIPRKIALDGEQRFDGEVYHSSEIQDPEILRDADVAVVGMGKSAQDISTESAKLSSSTTMIFRKANWMIPKKMWGVIPMEYLFFTRFGEAFLPRYYNDDTWRWLDRTPPSVKAKVGQIFEDGVVKGIGYDELPEEMVPETDLLDTAHGGTVPDDFVEFVQEGEIQPKKTVVDHLDEDGVHLDSGEYVEADVVVLATGHRNEYPFLDDDVELKRGDGEEEEFYLYRGIVPPETDGIGVIGRRELFNNFLSMNLSAHWLSDYFRGDLVEMPTETEMHQSIQEQNGWMLELMPNNKGYDFGGYHYHTFDELLVDMGVPTKRRSNFLAEWFGLNAQGKHYEGLGEERRQRPDDPGESGSSLQAATSAYLSTLHLGVVVVASLLARSVRKVFL